MNTIFIVTKKQSKKFSAPIGTTIEFKKDRTIYHYRSGKSTYNIKQKAKHLARLMIGVWMVKVVIYE